MSLIFDHVYKVVGLLCTVCAYPLWGLRQGLDQGGAMRKDLMGFW